METIENIYAISLTSEESYFSHSPCELCNSSLSGNREDASIVYEAGGEIYNIEVCMDCVVEVCM